MQQLDVLFLPGPFSLTVTSIIHPVEISFVPPKYDLHLPQNKTITVAEIHIK